MTSNPLQTPTHPSLMPSHTLAIRSSSSSSLFLSRLSVSSPNPSAKSTSPCPSALVPPRSLLPVRLFAFPTGEFVLSPLPSHSPFTCQPRRTGPWTVAGVMSVLSRSAFQRERYMPGPCVVPFPFWLGLGEEEEQVLVVECMIDFRRSCEVCLSCSRCDACSSRSFLKSSCWVWGRVEKSDCKGAVMFPAPPWPCSSAACAFSSIRNSDKIVFT